MKKLLAALVVLVLAYVGSPYAAVGLLMRAVSQGDEDALAARIDFDALRTSLTDQIQTRMTRPGEPPDPMRQTLVPTLVNSFVTPRGFATMLRTRADVATGGPPADGASAPAGTDLGDLGLSWFFFTRPDRFEVESRRGTLVLEPRGAWWKVVDVKLPEQWTGLSLPMSTPEVAPPSTPQTPPDLEVPDFGSGS